MSPENSPCHEPRKRRARDAAGQRPGGTSCRDTKVSNHGATRPADNDDATEMTATEISEAFAATEAHTRTAQATMAPLHASRRTIFTLMRLPWILRSR